MSLRGVGPPGLISELGAVLETCFACTLSRAKATAIISTTAIVYYNGNVSVGCKK